MKSIFLLALVLMFVAAQVHGQENKEKLRTLENLETQTADVSSPDTITPEGKEVVAIDESGGPEDTTSVRVGDIVSVEETDDETIIRIGRKGVRIVEDGDDTKITIEEYQKDSEHHRTSFKGHLGGIEFGFTGYMSDFWTTSLNPEDAWLRLNTAKSTNFNLLLPNISLGFSPHFGMAIAIGFNWSDFHFDGNNSIVTDDNGMVIPYYPPEGITLDKTKLETAYAILPIIFEGQIPVSHRRTINIGAGFIGAIKLCSNTKIVYYDNDKVKLNNKDDFSLNLLRYGATLRLGYEMLQIYGTTYFSTMFEKDKGPELYPFEVGIALTFNN